MKVVVFAVEYTVKYLGWGRVTKEFRSGCRIPFFYELIKQARNRKANLVIFPGGFFRSDYPDYIASILENDPPKVAVLVGRDNVTGNKCEVWVIAPNGKIKRKILEAWIYKKNSKRQAVLNRITDRRFPLHGKNYAIFCCGDVFFDNEQNAGRKPPIFDSKAAFVLAHYSATGRNFTASMRKLGIPTFLSHHVKNPYSIGYFAYNGKKSLKPIKEFWNGRFQGLQWIGRVYSV